MLILKSGVLRSLSLLTDVSGVPLDSGFTDRYILFN